MLMDKELIFSEQQSITASAPSTNVVDLAQVAPTPGSSKHLELVCIVHTAVTGTIQFKLQDCATAGGTYADVAASATLSAPAAGTRWTVPVPFNTKRFIRVCYGGSPTAGKVTAYLTMGRQEWAAAAEAQSVADAKAQIAGIGS